MSTYVKKLNTKARAHIIQVKGGRKFLISTFIPINASDYEVRAFMMDEKGEHIEDKTGLKIGSTNNLDMAKRMHNDACIHLEKWMSDTKKI